MVLTLLLTCMLASHTCAQVATRQPTTQPASHHAATPTNETANRSDSRSGRDQSQGWLDRISDRADHIGSIQANIRYDRRNHLLGDEQRRFGELVFIAGPPARYAIHFNKVMADDGRSKKQDRWYLFDGVWLVERLDDQKQFFKRQIVAPDAKPEDVDPLASGRGPFSLPLTARKHQVLEKFNVTLVESDDRDNNNADANADEASKSIHLRLSPLPHRSADLAVIDVWYDRELLVPVRVSMLDPDGENEQEFTLRKIVVNDPVDESVIDVSEPRGRGWLVEITPWQDAE